MRMLSALRWVFVAVIALVLLAPFVMSAATGLRTLEVDGGSMAPAYQRGDLVVIDPTPVGAVEPGEVVTVRRPSGVLYTHRVDSVGDDGQITTRGDANPVADDEAVSADDIVGVVRAHVPHPWATVITVSQSLPGRVSLALVLVGLVLPPGAAVSRGKVPPGGNGADPPPATTTPPSCTEPAPSSAPSPRGP